MASVFRVVLSMEGKLASAQYFRMSALISGDLLMAVVSRDVGNLLVVVAFLEGLLATLVSC